MTRRCFARLRCWFFVVVMAVGILVGREATGQGFSVEEAAFSNESGRLLSGRLYRPSGEGPFPAVVILHGSGGMWRDDDPVAGVMKRSFLEWATNLTSSGWHALFVDSFTPREIVEFRNRRPAEDPSLDDSICSPAHERPKDALAALRYLRGRADVRADRVALLGFSHGAEAAIAAAVHPEISRASWTVSYLFTNGTMGSVEAPSPVRLAPGEAPFSAVIGFYPGCGFFNYFGSPSSTNANLYYPSAPVLILHGGADPLYAANLYPERLRSKAETHARLRGDERAPVTLTVYPDATHSFDEVSLPADEALDNADQRAKREGRARAMVWLECYLGDLEIEWEASANQLILAWDGIPAVPHVIESTQDFLLWQTAGVAARPDAGVIEWPAPAGDAFRYFRVKRLGPGLEPLW